MAALFSKRFVGISVKVWDRTMQRWPDLRSTVYVHLVSDPTLCWRLLCKHKTKRLSLETNVR